MQKRIILQRHTTKPLRKDRQRILILHHRRMPKEWRHRQVKNIRRLAKEDLFLIQVIHKRHLHPRGLHEEDLTLLHRMDTLLPCMEEKRLQDTRRATKEHLLIRRMDIPTQVLTCRIHHTCIHRIMGGTPCTVTNLLHLIMIRDTPWTNRVIRRHRTVEHHLQQPRQTDVETKIENHPRVAEELERRTVAEMRIWITGVGMKKDRKRRGETRGRQG
mmetsp:Transcript_19666/g.37244  ORF Transcript_19666/g.37244 Transcript_19666/m.37244 type:complete len:216 (-) Transcript_19666:1102-1749(-)